MRVHAEPRSLEKPLSGGRRGATVTVEPLDGGWMHAPPALFERSPGAFEPLRRLGIGVPRARWLKVPVPAFLVRHPTFGPFLIDTGLHPSIEARPSENLGRIMAWAARPELEAGGDIPARLREREIDPKRLRLVVLTHLHLDHASGISEFPNAAFILAALEWEAIVAERRPLLRGYRKAHFDYAFDYRLVDYDDERVTSYGSFGRTYDLFADGSVRLAFTPGHTAGHQSVILRLEKRDMVIAGDAIYTMRQLEGGPEPPMPVDRHQWRRSVQELRLFRREYPEALIVPGHDAEAFRALDERYA